MISGKHVGCHLEFFKIPKDDKVSSARFLKNNAYTTRIHQEKNFIPNYQVHRKSTKFLLDYMYDVRVDILGPQHGTTSAAVIPNKIYMYDPLESIKHSKRDSMDYIAQFLVLDLHQ